MEPVNKTESPNLSKSEVEDICNEIDHQWEYHLMTRAVFTSTFPEQQSFCSPVFYSKKGLRFEVKLPIKRTKSFIRASNGIAYWHNQNFVIRLFGILNSKGIMKYGKTAKHEIMILIDILRNNVGAHSSGRRISRPAELRKATHLINKYFEKDIDLATVTEYALPVDKVLKPLKDYAIRFVKTLEDGHVTGPNDNWFFEDKDS